MIAIVVFVFFSGFAFWIVFRSGAARLEHSLAALLVDGLAPLLSAHALRAYVVFLWLVQLIKLFVG